MSRRMVEIYIFCMKNKLSDNGSRKNLWQFGMEQEEDFSGVLHCLKKMVFEGELRLMFMCALFLFIYCAITTLIFENTFQHFFCPWQSLGKCKSTTTILSKPFLVWLEFPTKLQSPAFPFTLTIPACENIISERCLPCFLSTQRDIHEAFKSSHVLQTHFKRKRYFLCIRKSFFYRHQRGKFITPLEHRSFQR